VIAAMKAVEEETIQRCAGVVRAYAVTKNDSTGEPSSRISAAKQMAAHEIVSAIKALPRKSV
ncbi:MAG: hypothetical protein ACYCZ0_04870, partial [Minisyncoccota bacterium]